MSRVTLVKSYKKEHPNASFSEIANICKKYIYFIIFLEGLNIKQVENICKYIKNGEILLNFYLKKLESRNKLLIREAYNFEKDFIAKNPNLLYEFLNIIRKNQLDFSLA